MYIVRLYRLDNTKCKLNHFHSITPGDITVTIEDVDCPLVDIANNYIVCTTGPAARSVKSQVVVNKAGSGIAMEVSIIY